MTTTPARPDATPTPPPAEAKPRQKKPRKKSAKTRNSQTHASRVANLKRRIAAQPRHTRALEMRRDGATLQQIADALGYSNKSTVKHLIDQELKRVIAEPAEQVRKLMVERLERLWREGMRVLESHHVFLHRGRVIFTGRGKERRPLENSAPVLDAIAKLNAVAERICRLQGLDAPTKIAPTDPTGERPYAAAVTFYLPQNYRDVTPDGETKALLPGNGNGNGNGDGNHD